MHVSNLLRLSGLLGEPRYRVHAERCLEVYGLLIQQQPRAVSRMMQAVHHHLEGPREVVVAAASRAQAEPLLEVLRSTFAPPRVVLLLTEENRPALEALSGLVVGRDAGPEGVRAYVCRDFVCEAPVGSPEELRRSLGIGED